MTPRSRADRAFRTAGWLSVVALLGVAILAPTGAAGHSDAPGNNGTVKIHEGATETEPGPQNEPHVCVFHLHFFFADPDQAGTWEVREWAPGEKGALVLSGTYDTTGRGEDRDPKTGVHELPDGHYKLFWDGDADGLEKHKVFWVTCGEEGDVAGETPTPTPEGSVAGETGTPAPTPTPTATPEGGDEGDSGTPTPTGSAGEVLAETGTPAAGAPGVTLPPTDAGEQVTSAQAGGWRAVLLIVAGLLATTLVLTPATRSARRR